MSKKISELTAAGALTGTELVEVVQSSASRRTTAQNIANLAGSGISGLTTGRLPKAASSTTIDDSVVHQNSTSIGIGTTSPDRKFHVEEDSATTNAVSYVQRLTSTSSGTPANGIGVGVEFEVETSSGNNEVGAAIDTSAIDVTGGSEDFQLSFKLMTAGAAAAEVGRFEGGASAGNLTLGGTAGGNLTLGRASVTSGAIRQITAAGSATNINIEIIDKGSGGVSLSSQSGDVILKTSTDSAVTKIRASTPATNTVINHLVVERSSTGTAATGIGAGIAFSIENATSTQITGATIETISTDVTAGSEDFDVSIKTMAAGAAASEAVRIKSDKSTTFTGPAVLPSYTVAGVPAAGSYTGGMIFVSNETGGAVPAFSDGANWRRVTDRAIIS